MRPPIELLLKPAGMGAFQRPAFDASLVQPVTGTPVAGGTGRVGRLGPVGRVGWGGVAVMWLAQQGRGLTAADSRVRLSDEAERAVGRRDLQRPREAVHPRREPQLQRLRDVRDIRGPAVLQDAVEFVCAGLDGDGLHGTGLHGPEEQSERAHRGHDHLGSVQPSVS